MELLRNMEFGVEMNKVIRATMRRGYSSVRNHPCLLGLVYCLFLLYRSFPLLFSLLITASPVLVCTAALLGILLSFGQSETNYYYKEEEKEATGGHDDIVISGVLGDTIVNRGDSKCIAELFLSSSSKRRRRRRRRPMRIRRSGGIIREKAADIEENQADTVDMNQDYFQPVFESAPLINIAVAKLNGAETHVLEDSKGKDNNRDDGDTHPYGLVQELRTQLKTVGKRRLINNKSHHVEKEEAAKGRIHDGEDDSEESSLESDDSESCMSPDSSTDDGISPLLDELDPLLDGDQLEATPYVHLTDNGSDEQSHRSRNSSTILESNDDIEEEEEEEEDEDDNDEEEEDEVKEADNKKENGDATIIWTEDDQKNLMDLGTLELERNQQLENLIAQRKGRSSQLMEDMNLIDLDAAAAAEHPLRNNNNIPPPIATMRRNPFDGPSGGDSYVSSTPVPGSAPSMLLPRRNPFDLPYDDPNNGCQQQGQETFMRDFQPSCKETGLFPRHESFSTGGPSKQDIEMSPFFVPENNFAAAAVAASEATSYQSLQRQSNGSNVADDTESVVSSSTNDDDDDDKRVVVAVAGQEDEVSLFVEHGSVSSDVGDVVDIEKEEEEQSHDVVHTDDVEITLGGESETQLDNSSLLPHHQEKNQLAEAFIKEVNSSRSSSSVYSEMNEKIDAVKKDQEEEEEEQRSSSRRMDDPNNEEPSFEKDLEFSFVTTDQGLLVMDENTNNNNNKKHHHKEPLYDSSPPAGEGYLSFSSDSSDMQPDEAPQVKDDHANAENENNNNSNTTTNDPHASHPSSTSPEHNNIDPSIHDVLLKKYLSRPGDTQQPPSSSSTCSIPENLKNGAMHIKGGSLVSNEDNDTGGSGNHFHDHMLISDEPSNSLVPGETSDEADDDMAENILHEEENILSTQDQVQLLTCDASTAVGSSIHNNLGRQQEGLSNIMLREEVVEEEESTEQIINGGTEEGNNNDEGRESVAVSTLTSKSPSFSSGSSDYNTPMGGFNFRDNFSSADFEFEFGGFTTHMSDQLQIEHYKEAFGSQVVYEIMNEVVDDMREIDDDGLLSESEAVGDLIRIGGANEEGGEVIEDDGRSVSGSSDGNNLILELDDESNVTEAVGPQPVTCNLEEVDDTNCAAAADQNHSNIAHHEQIRDSESNSRSRLLEEEEEGAHLLLLPSSVTTHQASTSSSYSYCIVKERSLKDIHSLMTKRLLESDDVPKESESPRKSSQLKQTHQLGIEIQSTTKTTGDIQSTLSHQEPKHVSDQTSDSTLSPTHKKQRSESQQPILFCFHVAMRDSSAWAAVACIDSNGDLLKAWSDNFAAANSQQGEALAALKAIQLALVDQQPTLFLGGETRDIVEGIKFSSDPNTSNFPHAVTRIIDAAKTYLLSFRCWDVFHISEPDNFIAQNLANWAYSVNHVGPIDVSSLPTYVLQRESHTQTQLNY